MIPGKNNNESEQSESVKPNDSNATNLQQSSEDNTAAFNTAEDDIAHDPDLSIHSPNDDLDEGEIARLGEDETDII